MGCLLAVQVSDSLLQWARQLFMSHGPMGLAGFLCQNARILLRMYINDGGIENRIFFTATHLHPPCEACTIQVELFSVLRVQVWIIIFWLTSVYIVDRIERIKCVVMTVLLKLKWVSLQKDSRRTCSEGDMVSGAVVVLQKGPPTPDVTRRANVTCRDYIKLCNSII